MQNKKVVAVVILFIAGFVLTYLFVIKKTGFNTKTGKQVVEPSEEQKAEYARIQNNFVFAFPCGITDFDSPRVKPMECDAGSMEKGGPVKMIFSGTALDEKGIKLKDVKLKINNGQEFYSDKDGKFESEIEVDSNKKAIVIVADKFGYSPVRKIVNAQMPNADWTAFEIPKDFSTEIVMREIEVVKTSLAQDSDITITSDKYPGLSVTIPAGGLENAKGEIITGEITGEITYLDPKNPKDASLVPGFDFNGKQMIGIDHKGRQVILDSKGMVFFHFKKEGNDEILQPRKGTMLTITQPMPEDDYKAIMASKDLNQMPDPEEDQKLKEQLGLKDGMSDQEIFEIFFENDMLEYNYWYFNQKTGLWEEWPVANISNDVEKKINIMKVSRLY